MDINSKDFQVMKDTLDIAESRNLTDSEKNTVEKGITLVKFILYGQTQNIQPDTKLPSRFSCLEKSGSPPIDLVVRAEILLRNKFKSDSAKRDIEDQKRAKSFIESINKAKNHEVYLQMTIQAWHNFNSQNQEIDLSVLKECFDLEKEFFPWPWQESDWSNLAKNNRQYLLISDGRNGFALWELDNHPHAYLLKIITAPNQRGTGIASLLMELSIEVLRSLKFEDSSLEVQVDNKAAITFYLKHSWVETRRIKIFYANGQDAFSMVLKLQFPP